MPIRTQSNAQNHVDSINASQNNHHEAATFDYTTETSITPNTSTASSNVNDTQPTEIELKEMTPAPLERIQAGNLISGQQLFTTFSRQAGPDAEQVEREKLFLKKKQRKEKKNEKNNQGWTKSEKVEGHHAFPDIDTQLAHIGEPEANQPQKRSKLRKNKTHNSAGTPLNNGTHGNLDDRSDYSGSDEPVMQGESSPLTETSERSTISTTASSSSSGEWEENTFKQVYRRKKIKQKQSEKQTIIQSDRNPRASSLEPTTDKPVHINNGAKPKKSNIPSQHSMEIEQTLPDYSESSFPALSVRRRSFGDLPNIPQPPVSNCSLTDDDSVKSQPIASSQNSWAACVAKGKQSNPETRSSMKTAVTTSPTIESTSQEMAAKPSESDHKTATRTNSQTTQAIHEMASSLVVNFVDFNLTGNNSDNALILRVLTDKSKILPRSTRSPKATKTTLPRDRKASSLPPSSKPVTEGVRFLDGITTKNEMVKSITFGFPVEVEQQNDVTSAHPDEDKDIEYTEQHMFNVESISREWEKVLNKYKKNGTKIVWLNKKTKPA